MDLVDNELYHITPGNKMGPYCCNGICFILYNVAQQNNNKVADDKEQQNNVVTKKENLCQSSTSHPRCSQHEKL
jgi:hypothetical protein